MKEFETFIFDIFSHTIRTWGYSIASDIYALAFLILNADDDLRRPTVRLLYNTETEWRRQCNSEDPHETRWNHPFWLQTAQASIATSYTDFGSPIDTNGIALRDSWIKDQGLWYDDQFEDQNFEEALEIGGAICVLFDQMCVRVAIKLREDGILRELFGQNVPIIFYDREALSPEAIALTHQANQKSLLEEYSAFINDSWRGDSP